MDTNAEPVVLLLCEDDPDHAELVFRSLRHLPLSHRIYHVEDGEAALDYLFRRGSYTDPQLSPRPHVVLLDLRMPKVDGLQVLEQIKASDELHRIPAVVLTTSDAEADVQRAYTLRANSYLVKPLELGRFAQMMQELGLYWLGWNRVAEG
jgi:CheY-like chemotaxis protein